jgi:hypothetical protein
MQGVAEGEALSSPVDLVHHCVFFMCGDLAAMWALFGFCVGIQGSEHCPCCDLKRGDQWRGKPSEESGLQVQARGWLNGTPIPLSPSTRFVLCTLHCLLRVGDFALKRLVTDCLNSREGKVAGNVRPQYGTKKKSKKAIQSDFFADPSVAFYDKKALKKYILEALAKEEMQWKEYCSSGEVFSKATNETLLGVAEQLGIEEVFFIFATKTKSPNFYHNTGSFYMKIIRNASVTPPSCGQWCYGGGVTDNLHIK